MKVFTRIFKRRRERLTIPELIEKFQTNTLSSAQWNKLDKWVAVNDANMKVFEEMTLPVQEPTGNVTMDKARRLANLFVKHIRKQLTQDEQDELDMWIGAADKNRRLFIELTDPKKVNLALHLMNS